MPALKWYERTPGYVKAEMRKLFARATDWGFMSAHCKHRGRKRYRGETSCRGVGYCIGPRPAHAK